MKSFTKRKGGMHVSTYYRNASASYDKRKRLEKAERQNKGKGDKNYVKHDCNDRKAG